MFPFVWEHNVTTLSHINSDENINAVVFNLRLFLEIKLQSNFV